jgi:hypothetical protein
MGFWSVGTLKTEEIVFSPPTFAGLRGGRRGRAGRRKRNASGSKQGLADWG